ncbi:MAG: hypothetical protein ACK559_24470, partial [bacterium]
QKRKVSKYGRRIINFELLKIFRNFGYLLVKTFDMKITSLLGKLIVEQSRFQVLYDKVVKPKDPKDPKSKGMMDFDTLKALIFADPTTKAPENFDVEGASIEDMDKVKAGKFVQWILKNYLTFKPSESGLPDDVDV